jgi:hypothetical protein
VVVGETWQVVIKVVVKLDGPVVSMEHLWQIVGVVGECTGDVPHNNMTLQNN